MLTWVLLQGKNNGLVQLRRPGCHQLKYHTHHTGLMPARINSVRAHDKPIRYRSHNNLIRDFRGTRLDWEEDGCCPRACLALHW
jgi:hypothetical protein